MKTRLTYLLVISACFAFLGLAGAHQAGAQMRQMHEVRNLDITGEIAMMGSGYIIRGKVPAEIFTILNPVPGKLDSLVNSGKTVRIKVKIVSGDNVEIESIDGKSYRNDGNMKKTKEGAAP